jgi:lysine 2,3-aminomutase
MAIELLKGRFEFQNNSLLRAEELKRKIEPYLDKSKEIPSGLALTEFYSFQKEKILRYFNATEKDWHNWRWQMKNRITSVNTLNEIFPLTEEQKQEIAKVGHIYRWAVSPYYLSLMDFQTPNDPIARQGIPKLMSFTMSAAKRTHGRGPDFSGSGNYQTLS